MLELYDGALDVSEILKRWYEAEAKSNYGAFIPFVGTVREENGIDGLSFDIYEPILRSWFESWQEKAKQKGAILKMAHSRGDVLLHQSSYIAAVFSPKASSVIINFPLSDVPFIKGLYMPSSTRL